MEREKEIRALIKDKILNVVDTPMLANYKECYKENIIKIKKIYRK